MLNASWMDRSAGVVMVSWHPKILLTGVAKYCSGCSSRLSSVQDCRHHRSSRTTTVTDTPPSAGEFVERVHLRNTHTRWSIVYAPRMKVIQTWVFRRCTLPEFVLSGRKLLQLWVCNIVWCTFWVAKTSDSTNGVLVDNNPMVLLSNLF